VTIGTEDSEGGDGDGGGEWGWSGDGEWGWSGDGTGWWWVRGCGHTRGMTMGWSWWVVIEVGVGGWMEHGVGVGVGGCAAERR
jgi:hypothetical protein